MLRFRQILCLLFMTLVLAQPVLAEVPAEEIVTAVYTVTDFPVDKSPRYNRTENLSWLYSLITAPLYSISDSGYQPCLASDLPEDVTAQYAGTFSVPADAERGYAFRIRLRSDACWEDGVSITAEDVAYSIRGLFQQEDTANDWLFLSNAAGIQSGRQKAGSEIVSLGQLGYSSVSQAWNAGHREFFVDTEGFWGLDHGWKSVSDRIRLRDTAMPGGVDEYFITPCYIYNCYLISGAANSREQDRFIGTYAAAGEKMTIEDLGLIVTGSNELVLILQDPATPSALCRYLQPLLLSRSDMAPGLSCGPYQITHTGADQMILEPNPNWIGAADPRGYDRILCQKIGT